ncbi:MAG: leucine-rich repeat domain-containing protein [Chitinispirillaceae bacterium]|nr:leucine-rich repeat domain-containing protein [Chitinispirillaceae bacterium]
MRRIAFAFFGAAALEAFFCTPAPARHEPVAAGITAASVGDTAASAVVPAAVAAAIDATPAVPVPPADGAAAGDSAAPKHNDTAVVRQVLDECGLVAVKPEQVTAWDSAGRVVGLDLSNRDLSTDGIAVLPAAIGGLNELRTLEAKNNSITAIPFELFNCKMLVKLDLASNKITFIPGAIAELKNLETLDLRYNGFGYLPPEIGALKKLVSLQLWGNKMVELEPAVTQLPALKEIYLKDNRLTTLPEGITRMKSLVYYDLAGNSICNPSQKIDAWLKKDDKRYREAQRCR